MDDFDSPATCFISTRVQHRVTTVTVRDDILILVRHGTKTLLGNAAPVIIKAGMAVVMARGSQWDVINDPGGDGRYEALVLQFGDRAVADFQSSYAGQFGLGRIEASFVAKPDQEFESTVVRAADSIGAAQVSAPLRRHKVMEVLLMLAEQGCILRPRDELAWPDLLKRLIAQRPHVEWTVDSLARACHTSASTLRRRLAGHDLTVGALVRDIRMEVAMLLLQTSALPVGDVAERCGYGSHSRFSSAFRARYGFPPSHLR